MEQIAELFTLLLAILGAFTKVVEESADGKWLRGRGGLPIITVPGWIVLILLVLTCVAKLWINSSSEFKHRSELVAAGKQIDDLKSSLRASDRKLEQANAQIAQSRTDNAAAFKAVFAEQKSDIDKTVAELKDASDLLRKGIKQSSTTVKEFKVIVFFDPVTPNLQNSMYRKSRGGFLDTSESVAKKVFCGSPVPLQEMFLWVPLTSHPSVDLQINFDEVKDGDCSISGTLHFTTDDGSKESNVDLGAVHVYKAGRRAALAVWVDGDDLKKLGLDTGLSLVQFHPSQQAGIVFALAEGTAPNSGEKVERYFNSTLPTTFGVSIDGSRDQFDVDEDLQSTWIYQRGAVDFDGIFSKPTVPLQNPKTIVEWNINDYL
jgi:hypothetical protein